MKNRHYIYYILCFTLFACHKDPVYDTNQWKGLELPGHFPKPLVNIEEIKMTQAGFELGRTLFYDPILSRNNTISCGSCHIQGSAFTHHGHDLSHGIDDLLGRRNTPAIQNVLWQNSFFWDGGVSHIDMISLNPIQNPVEMDESPENVLKKLKSHPIYPSLFEQAFGTNEINTARFLNAMTQFMAMLVSSNSRFDQYKRGEIMLSQNEMEGLNIFQQKCSGCHSGALFTDNQFRNNGLSSEFLFDQGRYEISLLAPDIGKFKVPSLRNVELTAPYMHNGQFNSLEQVIDHYANNVKYSTTLDPLLQLNDSLGIEIQASEKARLIDFLKTLTDQSFIHNPVFSEQE